MNSRWMNVVYGLLAGAGIALLTAIGLDFVGLARMHTIAGAAGSAVLCTLVGLVAALRGPRPAEPEALEAREAPGLPSSEESVEEERDEEISEDEISIDAGPEAALATPEPESSEEKIEARSSEVASFQQLAAGFGSEPETLDAAAVDHGSLFADLEPISEDDEGYQPSFKSLVVAMSDIDPNAAPASRGESTNSDRAGEQSAGTSSDASEIHRDRPIEAVTSTSPFGGDEEPGQPGEVHIEGVGETSVDGFAAMFGGDDEDADEARSSAAGTGTAESSDMRDSVDSFASMFGADTPANDEAPVDAGGPSPDVVAPSLEESVGDRATQSPSGPGESSGSDSVESFASLFGGEADDEPVGGRMPGTPVESMKPVQSVESLESTSRGDDEPDHSTAEVPSLGSMGRLQLPDSAEGLGLAENTETYRGVAGRGREEPAEEQDPVEAAALRTRRVTDRDMDMLMVEQEIGEGLESRSEHEIRELYQEFNASMRRTGAGALVDYESFSERIRAQRERLLSRDDVEALEMSVIVDSGTPQISIAPVGRRSA